MSIPRAPCRTPVHHVALLELGQELRVCLDGRQVQPRGLGVGRQVGVGVLVHSLRHVTRGTQYGTRYGTR